VRLLEMCARLANRFIVRLWTFVPVWISQNWIPEKCKIKLFVRDRAIANITVSRMHEVLDVIIYGSTDALLNSCYDLGVYFWGLRTFDLAEAWWGDLPTLDQYGSVRSRIHRSRGIVW
jgi:hypothetical protein